MNDLPQVREKYRRLRETVHIEVASVTQEALQLPLGSLRLTDINQEALSQQERWPIPVDVGRQIGWNWRMEHSRYSQNHPDRIEVAIWHGDDLCGLMLGKVSEGKLVVKMNFIQGSTHDDHPLRGAVVAISSRCAEYYASAMGIRYVGIQDPFDELIDFYRQLGFIEPDIFDPRNNALIKVIE